MACRIAAKSVYPTLVVMGPATRSLCGRCNDLRIATRLISIDVNYHFLGCVIGTLVALAFKLEVVLSFFTGSRLPTYNDPWDGQVVSYQITTFSNSTICK